MIGRFVENFLRLFGQMIIFFVLCGMGVLAGLWLAKALVEWTVL